MNEPASKQRVKLYVSGKEQLHHSDAGRPLRLFLLSPGACSAYACNACAAQQPSPDFLPPRHPAACAPLRSNQHLPARPTCQTDLWCCGSISLPCGALATYVRCASELAACWVLPWLCVASPWDCAPLPPSYIRNHPAAAAAAAAAAPAAAPAPAACCPASVMVLLYYACRARIHFEVMW